MVGITCHFLVEIQICQKLGALSVPASLALFCDSYLHQLSIIFLLCISLFQVVGGHLPRLPVPTARGPHCHRKATRQKLFGQHFRLDHGKNNTFRKKIQLQLYYKPFLKKLDIHNESFISLMVSNLPVWIELLFSAEFFFSKVK